MTTVTQVAGATGGAKRVAIYARVSTSRQAQAQTIGQQLERLLAHTQAQGWTVAATHVFRDDGYSGASLRRPGLERLRDRAAAHELDLVLLTAPDRLARHYVHQVLLLEELRGAGCDVQFVDRPMSDDPHDQLLLQVRGAVAEYERTLIAERMRRGRLAKLKAGLLLPWTRPPYGYRVDPERPRDPSGVRLDAAEAAAVREMFTWYAEEASSMYRLATKLQDHGVPAPRGHWRWNVATLRGILSNPSYAGQVWAGRERRRGPSAGGMSAARPARSPRSRRGVPRADWVAAAVIPAIVPLALFERVQAKLARNQQFASRHNTVHPYLLRTLVRCGRCGLACRGVHHATGHAYYVCRGTLPAIQSCRDAKCPARWAPAPALDALVWADLCALVSEPARVTQALERAHGGHWLPQELAARRDGLRRGVASLAQQQERLTDAYLAGVVALDEYRRRRGDLEQRADAVGAQLQQLEAEATRHGEVAGLAASAEALCTRVRAGLAAATFAERRQLVELLVEAVVVADGDVEIRYVVPLTAEAERDRCCRLRSAHFAAPAALDGRGELPKGRLGPEGRQVVFRLAGVPPLAHQPRRLARQVLAAGVLLSVCHDHTHRREARAERPLCARPPREPAPAHRGQDLLGRRARGGRHRMDAGAPVTRAGLRRGHRGGHVRGVDLLHARDADRPQEPARRERLAEVAAHAVAGVGQDAAVHDARRRDAVDLVQRQVELRPVGEPRVRHPGGTATLGVVRPLGGQEQPQRQAHGHPTGNPSPRASVSDTSVWQLVVLPALPAYCRATPTECRPCLSSAVSSTISTASGPPTRACAFSASTRSRGSGGQQEAHTKWCTWA